MPDFTAEMAKLEAEIDRLENAGGNQPDLPRLLKQFHELQRLKQKAELHAKVAARRQKYPDLFKAMHAAVDRSVAESIAAKLLENEEGADDYDVLDQIKGGYGLVLRKHGFTPIFKSDYPSPARGSTIDGEYIPNSARRFKSQKFDWSLCLNLAAHHNATKAKIMIWDNRFQYDVYVVTGIIENVTHLDQLLDRLQHVLDTTDVSEDFARHAVKSTCEPYESARQPRLLGPY